MNVKIHKVTQVSFNDCVFTGFTTRTIKVVSEESGEIEIVLFAEQLDQLAMTYNGVTYHD
jgi:hypothetical protein